MKRLLQLALLLTVIAAGWLVYRRLWRLPSPEELAALRREHQRLSDLVQQRLAVEAEPPGAPEATVVIGVPVAFAERFSREVSARLLAQMTLTLRDIAVLKAGDLEARLIVGRTQLGRYVASVHVDEVRAELRAGKPVLKVADGRLEVVLPVDVLKGAGRGRIRFRWDGQGMAGGVCGDFETSGPIAGTVVPAAYTLRARLDLTTEGSALIAVPELQDVVLPLRIEPSAETWGILDATVAQRSPVCRAALGTADVPEKVRALVERGFDVKLPPRLLPPVRLPVEMEKAVSTEGGPLRFQVEPLELRVGRATVWYRTDVQVLPDVPAAPATSEADAAVTTATAASEGETDHQAQSLEVVPVVEEHLEIGAQAKGD